MGYNRPSYEAILLTDLKNRTMENTFENALQFVRTLDERGSEWSESEKTLAAAMVDYHNEVVNKNALLADVSGSLLSDKELEETIWEEINVPLSQLDIDNHTDEYIKYLNAIHWAKFGRDKRNDR